MELTLTDEQKQFLFNKGYVTARNLDALVYPGWQNYFIKNYDWEMVEFNQHKKQGGLFDLYLTEKETCVEEFNLLLNFYNKDDLETLLELA